MTGAGEPRAGTTATRTIHPGDLPSLVGRRQPPSDWFAVDQRRIDEFARVTEDYQFIHVDPERASLTPMGTTIAHGFLILSLLSHLCTEQAIRPEGVDIVFNYGSNRVRFLNPVKVGSRIRAHTRVLDVTEKAAGRWLVENEVTVEIEGERRPALVAEILTMYVLSGGANER